MTVKADKGKTCVIIYAKDYNQKVHDFLNNKNFQKLKKISVSSRGKLICTRLVMHGIMNVK
jgi:predicted DNA binding CopG/RHH family protein